MESNPRILPPESKRQLNHGSRQFSKIVNWLKSDLVKIFERDYLQTMTFINSAFR